MILRYDSLCRAAIGRGADVQALFDIPSRERIGRAKSVESGVYQAVYAEIDAQMEREIEAVAERGEAEA